MWSTLYLGNREHSQDVHKDREEGGVTREHLGTLVDGRLDPEREEPLNGDDREVTEVIFKYLQTVLPTDTADIQQDGVDVRVRREGQADQQGGGGDNRDGDGDGRHHQGGDGGDVLLDTSGPTRRGGLSLVRRKYRLRNGVRRDGLLQPTMFNYSTILQNLGRGVSSENESFNQRRVRGVKRGFEK